MSEEMEAERQEALATINRALPVFRRINELYLSAININAQQTMARAMAIRDNKLRLIENKNSSTSLSFLFRLAIVIALLAVMAQAVSNPGYIVGLIVLLILAIVVCITDASNRRRFNASLEQVPGLPEHEDAAYTEDLTTISRVLSEITEYNSEIINAIPRDYRNYDAVSYLENVLANGRAYSMREALNLYEQYLHQQRLEASSQQTLQQAEKQSQMLEAIEKGSAQAARYSAQTAANTAYFVLRDFLS